MSFRPQTAQTVLAEQQRPETVLIQQLCQSGGVPLHFLRFALPLQKSQLQRTAVQSNTEGAAAAAQLLRLLSRSSESKQAAQASLCGTTAGLTSTI